MKKFFIGIIFLFLTYFIYSSSVFAAATLETKPAMQWHCLQNTRIAGHTVDLTTKPGDLPTANAKTYVVVCMTTELGNVCTTGDSTLDQQTLGYDGVTKLKQSTATGGYEQQEFSFNNKPIPKDSIVANGQGKLTAPIPEIQLVEPIRWTDYTPKGVGRKWLALNFVDPVKIEMGTGGEQQGTFTFEGALSRCIAIAWDPYGMVFDSQSLEPVTGVKVSLMKKAAAGTAYNLAIGEEFGSLLNPVYTQEDGAFSFYVPDGTYKLDVAAANFTFPNLASKLNSNYSKIYSDIYRGEDIIQKGAIQHRDIPLDSKTVPYTAPVKLMSYFPILDKGANIFIVQGRVSHPLTKINVYGKKPSPTDKSGFVRTRLLTSLQANKVGQFEIKVDLNKLDPTEMVGDIELLKPNYNSLTTFDSAVKATTFSVEPIPNYMEGYAYGADGKVLPNATVGVYLNFSTKPAYEVKADDKGYFVISSEFLPAMTYNVKYAAATGGVPISVSTSKFIAQNADYITTQHSNLYAFKNKKGEVFDLAKRDQLTAAAANNQPTATPKVGVAGMSASNVLFLGLVLAIFIVILVVFLVIYLLKKRETPPPPPPPPVTPPVV